MQISGPEDQLGRASRRRTITSKVSCSSGDNLPTASGASPNSVFSMFVLLSGPILPAVLNVADELAVVKKRSLANFGISPTFFGITVAEGLGRIYATLGKGRRLGIRKSLTDSK